MISGLFRKILNRKTMSSLIIICFLTISINQCTAHQEPPEPSSCYGFIVSSVTCENPSVENQINCKIKHMINDLLREHISVYWTSVNITASITEIGNDEVEKEMFFEKGSFVIPFTGNITQDTKLITIICDYNQSSEIEENNIVKVPVYLLIEQLTIQAYPLSEVKIVQYKGMLTNGESFYVEIAGQCGFLTFEFVETKDLAEKLEPTSFNVIMWPGLDLYNHQSKFSILPKNYRSELSIPYKIISEDLKYKVSNVIRDFVNNGGGYVGSCYGGFIASCGMMPIPIYLKRRAYNPRLHSVGLLAISDVLTAPAAEKFGTIQERIVDDTHPVTYGLDTVLFDSYFGGPKFVHIGENSQVVALFEDASPYLDGTPSWISSTFGNGKVMLFSSHPETIDSDTHPEYFDSGIEKYYAGKKVISNTLYYTTSKEITEPPISHTRNLSFITEILEVTTDVSIDTDTNENIFEGINIKIDETVDKITNLTSEINTIKGIIQQIADENDIDLNEKESEIFLYYSATYFLIYYLDLFTEYLENTTDTLNTLEKIYPLLENNTEFVKQIETLKTDLSTKINETRDTISESLKISEEYKEALLNYQQNQRLPKLHEFKIVKKGHELEKQVAIGFEYAPQAYFNSLKLLRNSWYSYETSIAH